MLGRSCILEGTRALPAIIWRLLLVDSLGHLPAQLGGPLAKQVVLAARQFW